MKLRLLKPKNLEIKADKLSFRKVDFEVSDERVGRFQAREQARIQFKAGELHYAGYACKFRETWIPLRIVHVGNSRKQCPHCSRIARGGSACFGLGKRADEVFEALVKDKKIRLLCALRMKLRAVKEEEKADGQAFVRRWIRKLKRFF